MTANAAVLTAPWFVRFRWWHPEWWIYVAAAAAWALLVLVPASGGAASGHNHHSPMATAAIAPDLGHELAFAGLMAVAMMAPLMAPLVRFVALAGPWRRRVRGPVLFMASYLAVWALVGLVLAVAAGALFAAIGQAIALALATIVALAWQLSRRKRRALRRCARTMPVAPTGRRADLDCLRFGLASAQSCVVTCWGLMAIATASHHAAPVLGILFVLQVRERSDVRFRPRLGALIVALLGTVLVVLAIAPLP